MIDMPSLLKVPERLFPNMDLRQQAEDNALCNPGTLRIEGMDGNILWSSQ